MKDTRSFGEYIRALREAQKLPLRKVAAVLDLDPSTLSKIERGERSATIDMIDSISDLFEVDSNDLRVIFHSDKVAYALWLEDDTDEILQVAEEKIKYIRKKKTEQGTIEFNPNQKKNERRA